MEGKVQENWFTFQSLFQYEKLILFSLFRCAQLDSLFLLDFDDKLEKCKMLEETWSQVFQLLL